MLYDVLINRLGKRVIVTGVTPKGEEYVLNWMDGFDFTNTSVKNVYPLKWAMEKIGLTVDIIN